MATETKMAQPPTVLTSVPSDNVGKKVQQVIDSATSDISAKKIECVLNEADGTWTITAYQTI